MKEKNGETSQGRLAPLRSARRPFSISDSSKNHSKTRESKIFSYRFLRFLSKMANKKDPKHPEVLGSYNYFSLVVLFEIFLCPTSLFYARALEKIQKGAGEIKRAHRCSLHSVPLAPPFPSKPNPSNLQVHPKQN